MPVLPGHVCTTREKRFALTGTYTFMGTVFFWQTQTEGSDIQRREPLAD